MMEFSGGGTHINNRIVKKKTTQRTRRSHKVEVVQVEQHETQFLRITRLQPKVVVGRLEEANKGKWGMPGQRVPKKDVVHCEKRR